MEVSIPYTNSNDLPPTSPQDEHLDELQFGPEEFSEEDVLPFLLQAQDIISKLESRVVELETDLSSIHRKYEHDRHDWLVGLSQKDQYIHYLSSKLQKLEFNSKEAIVHLSEMVGEEKLAPELNSDQIHTSITLCLNYLRLAQQTSTPDVDPPTNFLGVAEDLEEGEMERRQAAANEWRRREEISPAAEAAAVEDDTWSQPHNLMDGIDSTHNSIDGSENCRPADDIHSTPQTAEGCPSGFSTTTSVSSMTRIPSSEDDATSLPRPTSSLFPTQRTSLAGGPSPLDHTFCANCRQLLVQLDQQIEQKAYLKRDLGSLASALAEEEQLRVTVEQTKDALEEDVQEIASSLFDSLNHILMDEVTDRDGLVRMNREMSGKVAGVLQAWDAREQRLKHMKELLVDLDSVVHQSANNISYAARYQPEHEFDASRISLGRPSHLSLRLSSTPSSSSVPLNFEEAVHSISNRTIRIDGLIFSEFQQHLKALSSAPQVTMPSTPFMKRVVTEDVDPCLFQNAGSSWWKSPWFKRKLIDAITRGKCEIQGWHSTGFHSALSTSSASSSSTSPSASHISTASSAPGTPTTLQPPPMPPKTKCACCGLLRVCEFRMRLQATQPQQKQQPWLPIDRFCRDRLVAVCDFYNFISHLRQGLMQNSPVLGMFKQSLYYRRRMALAKIGSMGLFEEDPRSSAFYRRDSSKRRSRSSAKRESIVLDHSGSSSDTGSVVSVSDIQGLDGTGQIVIVH
ncbi:hypothetical protein DFQ28_005088 [Apophysomyces sp. BC1034]|nr:hypothetical protein DFQ30_010429 [Apophysomyces sp. BC1015]KAG0181840.1 hypothetical protein DFQ29_006766 [Apophysomyces sp. BC1021]KAG0193484.1 hypothetical protein DFQ28_005088 [Apophysomyces sp. BC1034]